MTDEVVTSAVAPDITDDLEYQAMINGMTFTDVCHACVALITDWMKIHRNDQHESTALSLAAMICISCPEK